MYSIMSALLICGYAILFTGLIMAGVTWNFIYMAGIPLGLLCIWLASLIDQGLE